MTVYDLPLSSVLRSLGYAWQNGPFRSTILRSGEVVFVGDAGEVWDWLTATWWQRCGWAETRRGK